MSKPTAKGRRGRLFAAYQPPATSGNARWSFGKKIRERVMLFKKISIITGTLAVLSTISLNVLAEEQKRHDATQISNEQIKEENQNKAFKRLLSAKSLQCEFKEGYAVSWKKGKPEFESGSMGASITFDSINLQNGTARTIANVGAGDVIVIPTASGLSFMEKTASGNLVFTTVFHHYTSASEQHYVAVTSRHMDMLGPFPSQYQGTCAIWE